MESGDASLFLHDDTRPRLPGRLSDSGPAASGASQPDTRALGGRKGKAKGGGKAGEASGREVAVVERARAEAAASRAGLLALRRKAGARLLVVVHAEAAEVGGGRRVGSGTGTHTRVRVPWRVWVWREG